MRMAESKDEAREKALRDLAIAAAKRLSPERTSPKERIRIRNEKLAAFRERAGLSMDDLAREMGFKGQSSIQRYLSPTYDKGFRPELAARFKAALVNRGNPPITPAELDILDNLAESSDGTTFDLAELFLTHLAEGGTTESYQEQLTKLGLAPKTDIDRVLRAMQRSKQLGFEVEDRVVGLPLDEGDVVLKMPRSLSSESAATLRDWLEHLIGLATRAPEK